MKKIIFAALLLCLGLVPVAAHAATVTFPQNANLLIGDETVIVLADSQVEEIDIDATSATFTLASDSYLRLRSESGKTFVTTPVVSNMCGTTNSEIIVDGNGIGSSLVVTMSSTICTGGSSTGTGGGGAGAPVTAEPTITAMPETTTGQVTATSGGGGKTALTTTEGTTATTELPAGAVSADTIVNIATESKATVVASRPTSSTREVIGSYVFNITGSQNGTSITSLSKTSTLSFSYTDAQVSIYDESTLRVFYWQESSSQWVALPTTVDAANNILTAETDHLTYFAVMGVLAGEEEEEIVEEDAGETALSDGDLVRNPNAEGMAQFDIYIVKLINGKKFKRLIVSPHVFESYEHFDKNGNGSPWDDVKDISQTTIDVYTVSDLVRAIGGTKVYSLSASAGTDSGNKQWLNMTASGFAASYDADSIYTINDTDLGAYVSGADIGNGGSATAATIIVKTASLRIRSSASLDGEVLTSVKEGEVYSLLDENDGWYKITANGVTGWCYSGDTGGYAAKQ